MLGVGIYLPYFQKKCYSLGFSPIILYLCVDIDFTLFIATKKNENHTDQKEPSQGCHQSLGYR